MKYLKTALILAIVAVVFCSASAMAAGAGKKVKLTVASPVTIGGQTLAEGEYSVTWEGTAGQVQVTVLKGKKVMVTTTATIQPRSAAYSVTALLTTKKGDTPSVSEIRPEGMKEALVLEPVQ